MSALGLAARVLLRSQTPGLRLGLPPGRLFSTEGCPCRKVTSVIDTAVGLTSVFTCFLTPAGYMLSNMKHFRKS